MKAILISLALLAILLLAPGRNKAQTIVKPGDPLLRSDLIRSSHTYYKAVVTDTADNIVYEWVNDQVISVDSAAGRITFARARQVPVGSYSTDTSITDLSFKPISMHEVHYRQNVSFTMDFDATNATVHTMRKGSPSDRSYPMKSGYFEDNMIEYVYGYLDLAKDRSYTLDNFNKDTPSPSDPVTVEYAFDDVWMQGTGGLLYCRVLHFTHGAVTGYIWIDKKTRAMIREMGRFGKQNFCITRI
ncbi:MAG TPA: hypothetical protein VGS79_16120 [Puia sp.]|nr:hypothetical protein [Puia sp.]